MKNENKIKIHTLNSMDKVFLDGQPALFETKNSMFRNERFHFQLCMRPLQCETYRGCSVKISGGLEKHISVRLAEHIPCHTPAYPDRRDDYYLSDKPGLYPDLLTELENNALILPTGKWTSVWITVDGTAGLKSGLHDIRISIENENKEALAECEYRLEVIGAELPEHDLTLTNWVHYDSVCEQHNVKVFSKKFYKVLSGYLDKYIKAGFNMLYVPLFTPPLDTRPGIERMTAQLVEISKNGAEYSFGFGRLEEFIKFAQKAGIKYFEFSHLFSQWGAEGCPKIIVSENGAKKKMFDYDTPSEGAEYKNFLDAFLPQIIRFAELHNLKGKCFFHLSDEPCGNHFERYSRLSAIVKKHIKGYPLIDALSRFEFYEGKALDIPIAAVDHAGPFIGAGADFWVYYCCNQHSEYVPNRFIAMPSQRNRILGFQLYLNNVKGFLHWGFNFYRSQFSAKIINPHLRTDALYGFPSGDTFAVYPVKDSAETSLRLEVFHDALQDYRALMLLESLAGRGEVISILTKEGMDGFKNYPRSAEWHLNFRKHINSCISQRLPR